MKLYEEQEEALSTILENISFGNRLILLSGAAGTGKTTLIDALVEALAGDDVLVCTPTNKAAQVLNSKGIEATTFYKRFYVLEGKKRPGQKPHFVSCRRILEARYGDDWRQRESSLPEGKRAFVRVLVVDEASMVGSRRLREMQSMCEILILIGDRNQLPPVGDEEYPAGVFNTLDATVELKTVRRQEGGSLILTLAEALRDDDPEVRSLISEFEPTDSFKELIRRGAQCLAFTNAERQRINFVTRKILGFTSPTPEKGDRMVITNNYNEDLINGTVVEIAEFVWDGRSHLATVTLVSSGGTWNSIMDMRPFIKDQIGTMRDRLEENLVVPRNDDEDEEFLEMTWAYCLTCHKAQGSEWEEVIVFDQRSVILTVQRKNPRAGLAPEEYARRWLYTAVTRAKRTLAIAPTHFAKSY